MPDMPLNDAQIVGLYHKETNHMPYSHLSGAIVTDGQIEAHEQAMLEQPVSVRDGDDRIEFSLTEPENEQEEPSGDETNVEVNVSTENEEESEETTEDTEGEDSGEDSDGEQEVDYSKADTATINEVAKTLVEAENGQKELIKEAVEKGLDPALMAVMEDEISKSGKLSAASYEALAKVGYSKTFVDAFIAGQEAVAQKFVNAIHGFAGGAENYSKLTAFIGANHPELAEAFNSAIERSDVTTIKAILSTGKELHKKTFGKAPARNVANMAKPAATAETKPEAKGFESRAEMVKAMSDPRYAKDAKYRREVELRVFASNF